MEREKEGLGVTGQWNGGDAGGKSHFTVRQGHFFFGRKYMGTHVF